MTERDRKRILQREVGVIQKNWKNKVSVALVYPNHYALGMANLGFQSVYHLFNQQDHIVCERFFIPDYRQSKKMISVESGRVLASFNIIAFSISFEMDYIHVIHTLDCAAIPFYSKDRSEKTPLVIAGGVAISINPEAIAPFIDIFLIGEAEISLPSFLTIYSPHISKFQCIQQISDHVPGVYIPQLRPTTGIKRPYCSDLNSNITCSAIISNQTVFDANYLIEVSRGCPHGCRFCSAGFIHRPPRFQSISKIESCMIQAKPKVNKIGLVGAAVSDLPHLQSVCEIAQQNSIQLAFSSLRANDMPMWLLNTLKISKIKTATIAPDAGTERMRTIINKGLKEQEILLSISKIVSAGIPNIKLYFMIGLPQETMDDVHGIVELCQTIKQEFLRVSRLNGFMGNVTVSLNCFVPKPFTPFQFHGMESISLLNQKINYIQKQLKSIPNIKVIADQPKKAYIQGLLSKGNQELAHLIVLAYQMNGNWTQAIKTSKIDIASYVNQTRSINDTLPWEIIDHRIRKSFLWEEYQKALQIKPSQPCKRDQCRRCGVC